MGWNAMGKAQDVVPFLATWECAYEIRETEIVLTKSKELALKPGTMSGRGCFLSASLVVATAWRTHLTASRSTWRTRGGARQSTGGGSG